jgi:hypothetical protein
MPLKHKCYLPGFTTFLVIMSSYLRWHKPCSVTGQKIRVTILLGVYYEEVDIDMFKYGDGIIAGSLLFSCPEKVAAGISSGCVPISQICKQRQS